MREEEMRLGKRGEESRSVSSMLPEALGWNFSYKHDNTGPTEWRWTANPTVIMALSKARRYSAKASRTTRLSTSGINVHLYSYQRQFFSFVPRFLIWYVRSSSRRRFFAISGYTFPRAHLRSPPSELLSTELPKIRAEADDWDNFVKCTFLQGQLD